jgi:hypothetical protein
MAIYRALNDTLFYREKWLNLIDALSLEELNTVPDGFNNNIIWNFGHTLVVQQLLVYRLGGERMLLDKDLIHLFKKGTRPEGDYAQTVLERLKAAALELIQQTEADYREGKFQSYSPYQTASGMNLQNAEDAIVFNALHEAMHFGVATSIAKCVKK